MKDLKARIEKLSPEQKKLFDERLKEIKKKNEIKKFVLTLQEGDSSRNLPVYCMHPPLGTIGYLINLVRHLSPNQPVYGIQSPAFCQAGEPFDKMDEMAACYIQAIRKLQAKGPFILMGHSSGANIAFEMAAQLEAKSQQAPLLILIDAEAPIGEPSEITIAFKNAGPTLYESAETLFLCAWCVSLAHGFPLSFSKEDLEIMTKENRYQKVADFFKNAGFIPQNAQSELVGVILKMVYNHFLADISYFERNTPKGPEIHYKGKTILFRCTEETKFEGFDIVSQPDTSEFSNWDKFCDGSIEVIGIPNANHITIIAEPAVKIMAEKLQTYLDQAIPIK